MTSSVMILMHMKKCIKEHQPAHPHSNSVAQALGLLQQLDITLLRPQAQALLRHNLEGWEEGADVVEEVICQHG